MPETFTFPVEKVRALRAYYRECAAGMKGKPERSDYENAALLCEQLLTFMQPAAKASAKKKSEPEVSA